MHGFRWPIRGMADSCVFVEKSELCYLILGGSLVLLCARLFADGASLVPHVAAHMKRVSKRRFDGEEPPACRAETIPPTNL